MRFDWDPHKNATNEEKHGVSFEDAEMLFTSGVEYLEIFDETHSDQEVRFIAIGPIERGVIVVVWTDQPEDTVRIISARPATPREVELFHQHLEDQS